VAELEDGKISSVVLDAQWVGLGRCSIEDLRGGTAAENAAILEGILAGKEKGPKREMTVANAAAGFIVAGLAGNMNEGIALARAQIDNGRALEKLRALQSFHAIAA
jgi:anthranilate phosphoribosyltransferase